MLGWAARPQLLPNSPASGANFCVSNRSSLKNAARTCSSITQHAELCVGSRLGWHSQACTPPCYTANWHVPC